MKKRYYPTAYMYEDDDGIFALHCKDEATAMHAMQECVDDYLNCYRLPEERIIIDMEKIKENRAYKSHRKCGWGYYVIGENICNDCGDSTNHQGISCFTYEI